MPNTSLNDELRKHTLKQGVDLFGVAELTLAREFIRAQGGDLIAQFPRGVSIGVRLLDDVVDLLRFHDEPSAVHTYQYEVHQVVNPLLDRAAFEVSRLLCKEGSSAYPVPARQTVNRERLAGAISHKLVAHLAGLGWIGKSCLLVTPEYGPRVRFASVLTDAPLKASSPVGSRCGDCRSCVEACPVRAFTGRPFNPSEPREARFNAELCREYSEQRGKGRLGTDGGPVACGLCVYVCPFGRKSGRP